MKIGVVGSINMDMVITAERIPKAGETIKGTDLSYFHGGKGANQAVAAAKLNGNVSFFGCIGDDSAGKQSLENLKDMGVDTSHIKIKENQPTGTAFITVGDNDNTIVILSGANSFVDTKYIDSVKNELLQSDIIILQHEIPISTVEYVTNICFENNKIIILNPAPAMSVKQEIIDKITYLTPNEHEAKLMFKGEESIDKILKSYPEKVIVTQGDKGASFCLKNGDLCNVPARKTTVVDTTGAGDTFNGAFAVGIASGKSVEEAVRFGNIAASISVESSGAQKGMPYYKQIADLL